MVSPRCDRLRAQSDISEAEVIVVDYGSRDESPQIIAEYGGRITPLITANGGQGSVFTEGSSLAAAM